jgi:hypothetical protein
MEERARRVGENEALLRIVNEQVATLNERFERFGEPMSAICECGRFDCSERVDVPARAYEEVRKDPARFIVKPHHIEPDLESVVEEQDGYWVIRKAEGDPAELARETAPR